MTLGVATVLTARDWEPRLVAHARETAAVRIVVRAFRPHDIDDHLDEIDVIVTSGDVSWVTPSHLQGWHDEGVGIVGLAIPGDDPAVRMLELGGVDEILPEHIDPRALVQAIRFVRPSPLARRDEGDRGTVVAVVGPRGAPGTTEVAIAYAAARSNRASAVLVDLDVEAPAIAIRMGLPPRPDLTDAADAVRSDGAIGDELVHRSGPLSVITGSHRLDEPRLKDGAIETVIRTARSQWDEVVLDVGATSVGSPHVQNADEVVLVVEASPVGIVRAADLVSRWIGPAPALVLNRTRSADRTDVVAAVRRWTGLEPAVVVGDLPRVRRAAASASPPDRRFTRAIQQIGAPS